MRLSCTVLSGAMRDVVRVVEGAAAALARQHADHRVGHAVHLDRLADRVDRAEQVGDHGLPDHHDLAGVLTSSVVNEVPCETDVVGDRQVGRVRADHLGDRGRAPSYVAVTEVGGDRGHHAHVRVLSRWPVAAAIGRGQVRRGALGAAAGRGGARPKPPAWCVTAAGWSRGCRSGLHRRAGALADGDQQDDRADADQDAEGGQPGAQLVGAQAAEGEAEDLVIRIVISPLLRRAESGRLRRRPVSAVGRPPG